MTFGTAILLLLGAWGCRFWESLGLGGGPSRPFSHQLHVKGQDLACEMCHTQFAKGDAAGMPANLKKCMNCHENIDEGKPPERKLAALFPEPLQWSRETDLSDEIIFSHKTHHEKGVACGECHRGAETNEGRPGELRLAMDDCMKCHAERQASEKCSACHKEIRRHSPPPSHHRGWKRTHGEISRAGSGRAGDNCALCHTESGCAACHQEEPPASHTTFWRLQGHAVAAGVDRSRCATCHRNDFCDRCHRETPPRNHVGTWGGTQSRHCLSCHEPAGAQRPCLTCHAGSRHETAPPRPADIQHAPATEAQCRSCHTVIGIPHLDNGDSCTGCH